LATLGNAGGVERAAHDVVTNTGKVFYTTAANKHNAMFLEIVAFAWDITNDLKAGL
jgi:hypothetical protein